MYVCENPNFWVLLCEETRSFRYVEESTNHSLISKSTLDYTSRIRVEREVNFDDCEVEGVRII